MESKTRIDPHGASLFPKRPKQGRGDSGASAAGWGEKGTKSIPDPPLGRPYPTYGPGNTGGTRAHQPPCVGELDLQARLTLPRGYPIPQSPNRTGGIWVLPPPCGGELERPSYRRPHGRPYTPDGPGRTGGTRCLRRCVGKAAEVSTLCSHPPPFIETSALKHR